MPLGRGLNHNSFQNDIYIENNNFIEPYVNNLTTLIQSVHDFPCLRSNSWNLLDRNVNFHLHIKSISAESQILSFAYMQSKAYILKKPWPPFIIPSFLPIQ
jgi:hypothetical protein